jgi:hypothetical protein
LDAPAIKARWLAICGLISTPKAGPEVEIESAKIDTRTMTQLTSHVILAACDGSEFAAIIGVIIVLALAARIGAFVMRLVFGVAQIGIGLIVLVLIMAPCALFGS